MPKAWWLQQTFCALNNKTELFLPSSWEKWPEITERWRWADVELTVCPAPCQMCCCCSTCAESDLTPPLELCIFSSWESHIIARNELSNTELVSKIQRRKLNLVDQQMTCWYWCWHWHTGWPLTLLVNMNLKFASEGIDY